MKPHPSTDVPAKKPPVFSCPCGQVFSNSSALIQHRANCRGKR